MFLVAHAVSRCCTLRGQRRPLWAKRTTAKRRTETTTLKLSKRALLMAASAGSAPRVDDFIRWNSKPCAVSFRSTLLRRPESRTLCPTAWIPASPFGSSGGAPERSNRIVDGCPYMIGLNRSATLRHGRGTARTGKKSKFERPGNLLGTALNPCQTFGMFVRTAMLSHFGGPKISGRRGPPRAGCRTRGASRDVKIGWREGCLLDILRPSGRSADSGRRGERECRPAEGRRRGGEKR